MTNNMMSLNAVLQSAMEQGASGYYEPFKEALFADHEVKASLVAVPQGPKRTVYYLPAEIGQRFAKQYAEARKKKVAPITAPPEQM